jgi:CMP-N,N'-diacetyllegionaminic acid synthase
MSPKILGLITARGGSKGIPGKNIKPLLGKPLIAHTIEAAKKSRVFDRIILSTDDEKIAEIGKKYGCEIPFIRPFELAQDDTPHLPVVQHAVNWLKENENYWPDYTMVLQPTSPLRQPFHIKEARDLILKTDADSVLAVSEVPEYFHPDRSLLRVSGQGFLKLFNGKPLYQRIGRRQDVPATYYNTSSIYLFKTGLVLDPGNPNFFGNKVIPYVIDNKYVVDINEPEDWQKVEERLEKIKMTSL